MYVYKLLFTETFEVSFRQHTSSKNKDIFFHNHSNITFKIIKNNLII